MKNKISKILGIGLAFVLVASMLVFAIPVSAGPYDDLTPSPVANKWVQFGPTQGAPPPGFWFYDPNIYRVGPIAEAIDGDLLCAIEYFDPPTMTTIDDILMSNDGGRTWSSSTAPNAYRNLDTDDGTAGAQAPYYVVDMVFSSLYEDVAYATDGFYVFKTIDGGNNWTFVNMNSLETAICGECGPDTWIPDCAEAYCDCSNVITSIDVGYDGNDDPIVFVGTTVSDLNPLGAGTVLWIADESWPAVWTDMDLGCYEGGEWCVYAVGCVPNFATNTTAKLYIAISGWSSLDLDYHTRILSSTGGTCDWTFVSELYWDCDGPPAPMNNFLIWHASRFAFSTSFESNSVMFLGVCDLDPYCYCTCSYLDPIGLGGDVYRIIDTPSPADNVAIDLNVSGFTSGCLGKWPSCIWSLDIKAGDALIAGAATCWDQDPTNVYYSNDGGWTWAESKKDPTGMGYTSVIWYDETALAATWDCNCALSMSCGTTVGEFWNQISLIDMDIDANLDLAHAPGYLDGSSTMYVLTADTDYCYFDYVTNLLRWDGSFWERVNTSMSYNWVPGGEEAEVDCCCAGWWVNNPMDWVECSPDFNQTGGVYLANTSFIMLRSMDEGCSWTLLTYPCEPRPCISAWIVVDSETVLAAGCGGLIYRTTYHGAQPWEEFPVPSPPAPADTSCGVDFDLSPNIDNDSSVLYGNAAGCVFLSGDLGETWNEIKDSMTHKSFGKGNSYNTYVVFDPGYGTAGDPGETMVYAAGGNLIGRCAYDATPGAKNSWVYISDADGDCVACDLTCASGIDAAGDTALYVSDIGGAQGLTVRKVTATGEVSVDWTGDLWLHFLEDEYGISVLPPVQGTIDLVGAEIEYEQGEFNDGELITHISDVLTATGDGNRYWTLGFEGLDIEGDCSPDIDFDIGDGVQTEFGYTTGYPIDPFTVQVWDDSYPTSPCELISDWYGDGTLWSYYTGLQAGTVNYSTGEVEVTFTVPPELGEDVYTYYCIPEEAWFFSKGNGVSGKLFVPPQVQVELGYWVGDEPDFGGYYGYFMPSTSAGTYDAASGYFSLNAANYYTGYYPCLHFIGTGYDGYAYIFVPISYPIYSFWGDFWGDIMMYEPGYAFPFPTVSGTIGVKGSYTGATGDITLLNETVWLPPIVWSMILEYFGMVDEEPLAHWFTGVGFNVVSTNLITDVTPGVAADTVIPSGVWRSLNPMDPMPPDVPVPFVEWSFLTYGLNSTTVLQHPSAAPCAPTVYPDDLWLTAGSNMLWALDANSWVSVPPGDTCSNLIWMWDDNLATPVVGLSPASGTELPTDTVVTLSWDELDKATLYEVELYSYCPACPDEKEKVLDPATGENFTSKDDCITITGLTPGTKYYWRVRVACDSPVVSKWSAEYIFDTAMGVVPYLCSPYCGQTNVILTPNFSWDPVAGATGYEVEVADNEDFSPVIDSASVSVNAWVTTLTLDYSTTYYWRVRAIKDGVAGAWSVCIFTTKAEPEAPVTPVEQVTTLETTEITPAWIWVIIGIGAALVIAVIVLIVMTRQPR